jgi:hypothetical protein
MRRLIILLTLSLSLSISACGGGGSATPDAAPPPPPAADPTRDILTTGLSIDLSTLTGTATIGVAPSPGTGLSFEAKGLTVTSVTDQSGAPLNYMANADGNGRLDVGVPISTNPSTVVIAYGFTGGHTTFDGLLAGGSTLTWPYFCGNLFPCHSDPADGVTMATIPPPPSCSR